MRTHISLREYLGLSKEMQARIDKKVKKLLEELKEQQRKEEKPNG